MHSPQRCGNTIYDSRNLYVFTPMAAQYTEAGLIYDSRNLYVFTPGVGGGVDVVAIYDSRNLYVFTPNRTKWQSI